MKKHLIVLFMVAVLAVSMFGAVDLTTSTRAQAAIGATTTTLHSQPFARVKDTYTITGTVKTSSGNPVLTPGMVDLYRMFPGGGWIAWKRVPLTSGTFATTDSQTNFGYVYYLARYLGAPNALGQSTSNPSLTYIRIGTFLLISATRVNGNTVNVLGSLMDQYQHGMSGQLIYVYKRNSATGNQWAYVAQTHTAAGGRWVVIDITGHAIHRPPLTSYYARFGYTNVYLGTVSLVTPAV